MLTACHTTVKPYQDYYPTALPMQEHVSHSCLPDIDSQDGITLHVPHLSYLTSKEQHNDSLCNSYDLVLISATQYTPLLLSYNPLHQVLLLLFLSVPTDYQAQPSTHSRRTDKQTQPYPYGYLYSPLRWHIVGLHSGK